MVAGFPGKPLELGEEGHAHHLEDWSLRFFFYSGDREEAPHIHVQRDEDMVKFWLEPGGHWSLMGRGKS